MISTVLVARAQSGSVEAMDRLLQSIQYPLLRHVQAITRDEDEAWDVLQEVLLAIVRKLHTLRDPRWFRAWAYRVATRAAVRYVHGNRFWMQAREETIPEVAAGNSEESPESVLLQAEAKINTLPTATRLAVHMHFIDGLSYREVAEALEISIGTVKSRIAYGRALLSRMVEEAVADDADSSRTSSSSG